MIFLRSKRLEKKTSDAREPSLYRSICTSIISTLLSLVMLVGTTFAWFTDSVTSNVFTITAGNFPAETYYWVGNNDPEPFSSEKIYSETTGTGWENVKKYADIFSGMQFNSENSSQSLQTVYLALVNESNQNEATYKFYFESVAESNSAGSNNIRDALTFTRKTADIPSDFSNASATVTSETRTLAEFAGTLETNSGPFVITVGGNTTKYVELTIGMNTPGSAPIAPSSIQLQLRIDITSGGGSANAALTTVRKTMRRPADRDEYSIADDSGVVTIMQTKPPVTEEAESNDTNGTGSNENADNTNITITETSET